MNQQRYPGQAQNRAHLHVTHHLALPAGPRRRKKVRPVRRLPRQVFKTLLTVGGRLLLTGVALGATALMLLVVGGLIVFGARAAGAEAVNGGVAIKRLAPLPPPPGAAATPALVMLDRYLLEDGVEVTEYALPGTIADFQTTPVATPTMAVAQSPAEEPTPVSPLTGWPVGGQMTQTFGCSPYFTGIPGPACGDAAPWFHDGVDIANIEGAPVRAALSGTVIFAGPDTAGPVCGEYQGYGLSVIVDNGQGWRTLYAHLSRIEVVSGQPVEPDTLIGAVGRTGCASGNHLHFAVRHQGNLVDPARLIPDQERMESSE